MQIDRTACVLGADRICGLLEALFMVDQVQATWEKLYKYYKLTDNSIIYAAATVLNPLFKWSWIEAQWNTPTLRPYLPTTLARIKQLWLTDYAEQPTAPVRPQPPIP